MAYNPSLHTVTNKPIGIAQPVPTDARSYFYDEGAFSYRPYASIAEVLSYLDTAGKRNGRFPIFITEGSKMQAYWFKNGTADTDIERIDGVRKLTGQNGSITTKAGELYDLMIITPAGNVTGGVIETSTGQNIETGRDMVAGVAYTYGINSYFASSGSFVFTNLGTFDIILKKTDL